MEKSITVRILGRDYTLRVSPDDEASMIEIAQFVDERMKGFSSNFPDQPPITTAVISALSIAEELYSARERGTLAQADNDAVLDSLTARLAEALQPAQNGKPTKKPARKKSTKKAN